MIYAQQDLACKEAEAEEKEIQIGKIIKRSFTV